MTSPALPCEAHAMPLLTKEIIAPDDYHTSEGVVRATPRRIRWWLSQFKKMKQKGLPVPIPWEHQEDAKPQSYAERLANEAKHNAGWVEDMFLDKKNHLWSVLDIPNKDDAKKIQQSVRFVSPEIDDEWEDGDGQAWHDIITHVALTARPVFYKQKPFGTPANLSFSRARAVRLSLTQRMNNPEVRHMADDFEDDDLTADTSDESGPRSDEQLLEEVCGLLDSKFGLHLPIEHVDTDTFLRDLCMALHGHPGHDLGDSGTADATDDDDDSGIDYSAAREEQPVAMMGH